MTESQTSISGSLIGSAIRVLFRTALVFEPLAPTAITLLINQQLHRFRDAGAIGKYKAHTKRLGKFHYRIEIDLELTGIQAVHVLANLFPEQFNRIRRWFHD
jgi:hypothetical protein